MKLFIKIAKKSIKKFTPFLFGQKNPSLSWLYINVYKILVKIEKKSNKCLRTKNNKYKKYKLEVNILKKIT